MKNPHDLPGYLGVRRKDPCPCGSGYTFRLCCLRHLPSNPMDALDHGSEAAYLAGDVERALLLNRADFSYYLLRHRAYVMRDGVDALPLHEKYGHTISVGDNDMLALMGLLHERLRLLNELGRGPSALDELDRLSAASPHPSWQAIIKYLRAFAIDYITGDRDKAWCALQELGDWRSARYSEFLEYWSDVGSTRLPPGELAEMTQRIEQITLKQEVALHYRMYRVALYDSMGDQEGALATAKAVVAGASVDKAKAWNFFGVRAYLHALVFVAEVSPDQAQATVKSARELAYWILEGCEQHSIKKAEALEALADCYRVEDRHVDALTYYDLAFRTSPEARFTFKKARCLVEMENWPALDGLAAEWAASNLAGGFRFEGLQLQIEAANRRGDREALIALGGQLRELNDLPAALRQQHRFLQAQLDVLRLNPPTQANPTPVAIEPASSLPTTVSEMDGNHEGALVSLLRWINSYGHLKPNFFGLGVNVNTILERIIRQIEKPKE